jgi:cytidylate kinase
LKSITIAIDGYSSTGKSTIARQLANLLHYVYVDTGAMYRAVTYFAMQNNYISDTFFLKEELINALNNIHIHFKFNEELGFAEVFLNNVNVEREIRTLAVSSFVSKVAEISEVRRKLVEQQQEMGKNVGVVMDGRDIGTVVFPNATLKFFMTASAEKRAKRRYDELINKGEKVSFEDILKNIQYRDHIDTTRDDSPLIKAEDAIVIDNSNLTLEEQFEKIYTIVKEKLETI